MVGSCEPTECLLRTAGLSGPFNQNESRGVACAVWHRLALRTHKNALPQMGFELGNPWIIRPKQASRRPRDYRHRRTWRHKRCPSTTEQTPRRNLQPPHGFLKSPSQLIPLIKKCALLLPINPSTAESLDTTSKSSRAWEPQCHLLWAVSIGRTSTVCPSLTHINKAKEPTACLMRVDKGRHYCIMWRPCALHQLPHKHTRLSQFGKLREFRITAESGMTAILPWRWGHKFPPKHQ
jgi:hypothetical protein